jgi:HD-GYP domain-containing protein (c-di-GMP phosphodiesterase class II)
VSIVDWFDAMLSSRAYRGALPVDEAVRRLVADTGTQFDPRITPLFISLAKQHLNDPVEGADDLPVGLAKILP